jgi:inner membrane protein
MRAPVRKALLSFALVLVVVGLDGLARALNPSPHGLSAVLLAALDEPAHLATAVLVVLCLRGPSRRFVGAALVASVAIDLDHVPGLLGSHVLGDGARPLTHSLAGAVGVGLVTYAVARRAEVAAGAFAGVLMHLVRDVATGPGIPALWPASDGSLRVGWASYLAALILLAAAAGRNGTNV